MKWKKVTSARYDEMLGMLPPAVMTGEGFMVGECWTHARCSISGRIEPMFQAFVEKGEAYYEATQPMSIAEFRARKFEDTLEVA